MVVIQVQSAEQECEKGSPVLVWKRGASRGDLSDSWKHVEDI